MRHLPRTPEKRAQYDMLRQSGGRGPPEPPPGWQPGDSQPPAGGDSRAAFPTFEQVFGQAGHGSRQGYSRQHFCPAAMTRADLAIFLRTHSVGESCHQPRRSRF